MAGAAAASVGASEAEALDLRAWGAVRRLTRPDGLLQVGEGSPLLDVLEGLGCGHGVIDAAELVVAERGDCFKRGAGHQMLVAPLLGEVSCTTTPRSQAVQFTGM